MNRGLLMILAFTGPLLDLQSYGERALTLWARFVSAAHPWAKSVDGLQGSAVIMTATATAAVVVMLAGLLSIRNRARRETQKLREDMAAQMARAEAAESANVAKAEFLASMSHQIRTPLNAIVGFTELALKTELAPHLREALDTVRTSADWLMYTVNDVLEFSRIEAGTLQLDNVPFSITECIHSVMKIVEREAAAKNLRTACKIDPELPAMVCGDPMRLRHILFNLLDNAVRFTTSGSVILSAALESHREKDVVVRVSVRDTGIGIPPAKQPLIFEPFRQVDGSANVKSRATVLGLPISRRLVELMGGTMNFQSQLGAGSTFEFTARFQKQKAEEVETSLHVPANIAVQELSILVVEDDAVSRRLITKLLESAGHRVWTAANGEEALHSVQNEAFDLIFMDMEMPGLDGLEATQAIRKNEAPGLHVPIYALTAHVLPSDRDKCLAAGMDGFLTKPIAMDEVLQLLSKLAPGAARTSDADDSPAREGKASTLSSVDVNETAAAWKDGARGGEFSLQSIWKNPGKFGQEVGGDADSVEAMPSLEPNPLVYLHATEAAREIDDSPRAMRCEADTRTNGVDNRPSAPLGLALLEAACRLTQESSSVAKQGENGRHVAGWDPFEQARKALSNSRVDVRVMHNNGDPSDRNLI